MRSRNVIKEDQFGITQTGQYSEGKDRAAKQQVPDLPEVLRQIALCACLCKFVHMYKCVTSKKDMSSMWNSPEVTTVIV